MASAGECSSNSEAGSVVTDANETGVGSRAMGEDAASAGITSDATGVRDGQPNLSNEEHGEGRRGSDEGALGQSRAEVDNRPDGAAATSASGASDDTSTEVGAPRSGSREDEDVAAPVAGPAPVAKPSPLACPEPGEAASSNADRSRTSAEEPAETEQAQPGATEGQCHAAGGRKEDECHQEESGLPRAAADIQASEGDIAADTCRGSHAGSSALPPEADDQGASGTDTPELSTAGSAGADAGSRDESAIRALPGAGGRAQVARSGEISAATGGESPSASAEPSPIGSEQGRHATDLQAVTSHRLSEPMMTPGEPVCPPPPDDEQPDAAPSIRAERMSPLMPADESNSETSARESATSSAEFRESFLAMGDTTQEEERAEGSPTRAVGGTAEWTAAANKPMDPGTRALEPPSQTAVASSEQVASVGHMEDGEAVAHALDPKPSLAGGDRISSPSIPQPPSDVGPTVGGTTTDGAMRGEASTITRFRATPLDEHREHAAAGDRLDVQDELTGRPESGLQKRPTHRDVHPDGPEGTPPSLDSGVDEIVKRLGSPVSRPSQGLLTGKKTEVDVPTTPAVTEDAVDANAAHRATETSATCPQDENISPARAASELERATDARATSNRQRRPTVSRETVGRGGTADRVGEDELMEDEAAVAVREAALRAAAQVSGASKVGQRDGAAMDSPDHVSRETLASQANLHGGEAKPDVAAGPEAARAETSQELDREQAARAARVKFRITRGGYSRFALAVANQKGGVGKSTTTVNLGAYLALAGARVLVVDLDPQGNASTGLGLDHRRIEPSVYDVLMGEADAAKAVRQTAVSNLDILPSTIDLAGAEVELVNAISRETRLRQALAAVRYSYDVVFIDCPPSLGLLTVNALAAADELLIPIQCEYYALEGLGQLLRNVDLVRVNLNPGLHIGGIVLTMYDGRTRLAEQVVQEVRKHFTDLVYQTVVPRSVRLSEAPGYGVPIALYDPLSRGGIAYRDLAFEFADRIGLLAPTQEGAS